MTPVRKMIKLVEDPLDLSLLVEDSIDISSLYLEDPIDLSLLVEDSIDVNSKPKLKPYPTKDNWYVIGKRK